MAHIYERPIADQFEAFADAVGDEIPLYTRLGRAIVGDQFLLDLAGQAIQIVLADLVADLDP